jgi:hypothetical protein
MTENLYNYAELAQSKVPSATTITIQQLRKSSRRTNDLKC